MMMKWKKYKIYTPYIKLQDMSFSKQFVVVVALTKKERATDLNIDSIVAAW